MSKIAAIQMCTLLQVDNNLETARDLITEAVSRGANLVVLPEMFATLGASPSDHEKAQEVYGSGKIQDFLAREAKKQGVWIVGGTIPLRGTVPNRSRAASLVYDSEGAVVARYDKMHLFDVDLLEAESYRESDTYEPGERLTVIDTPVGRLGLAVCFDIRFPALFTRLFNQGAEIIAIPSAFTVRTGEAHWHVLTRSRAIENFCYVVGACQEGVHSNGRRTYGHSVIVEPWGSVVSELGQGEGVIYSEIDLEYLRKVRASIPVG